MKTKNTLIKKMTLIITIIVILLLFNCIFQLTI